MKITECVELNDWFWSVMSFQLPISSDLEIDLTADGLLVLIEAVYCVVTAPEDFS